MIWAKSQALLVWLCILVFALPACRAVAQDSAAPAISANQLVREVVRNEVAAAEHPGEKHFFRSRKQTPKGSQTRLYVETQDAMAGMLIAANDQPLTPEQQRTEANRLNWLTGSPEQLRKKKLREKEDADHTLQIVKALPDAFLFEYAPKQDAGTSPNGSSFVRMNFKPNPAYSPPSHEDQALEGMEGYVLIDATHRRLARIDGTLFKDVTFGWGIVGRLDKGGHFFVEQAEIGDGDWDITEMKLDIRGKIFLFKTLSMVSDEVFSNFRRVSDTLTFAQGVKMLEAEQEKPATATNAKTTPQ